MKTQPVARPLLGTALTAPILLRAVVLAFCLIAMPPAITSSAATADGCAGDCDGSRRTTINELVRLVNLALSGAAAASCSAGDVDGNQRITVEELVSSVRTSLAGCSALPPTIDVASLCFLGVPGTPPGEQSINITKSSGNWSATANVGWISVNPSQGTAPAVARIVPDVTGLGEGMHEATVTISDASGSNATVAVTINLAQPGLTAGWTLQTVAPVFAPGQGSESVGLPTQPTSLALGPDGRPAFTFYRNDVLIDRELQFAQFTGCTWHTESIEKRGIDSSLAFDANGHPHVSYGRTGALHYARKTGETWEIQTVEEQLPKGDTGHRGSLALDSRGRPHISFLLKFLPGNVFTYDLHYAVGTGDNTWSIETPDAEGTTGWDTSIALNQNDEPSVTYHSDATSSLWYAEKRGGIWTTASIAADGKPSSLRLDASGRPRVAFNGLPTSAVNFAYRDDDSWHVENIGQQGNGPRDSNRPFVSLALDSAGGAHVAFVDFTTGTLKYASRAGENQWVIQTIDQGSDTGDFCSLQIDQQDTAHISYLDLATGVVKYARGPARP